MASARRVLVCLVATIATAATLAILAHRVEAKGRRDRQIQYEAAVNAYALAL
jgi:hypothetical protein